MIETVYLSPHLDDAVLSCGARIAYEVAAGHCPLVVTVFTADEPETPPSPLAADLRRWWNLPVGEVMLRRRAEDAEATRRLGADRALLDLPEAPYRLSADGAPYYATLDSLFGAPAPADEEAIVAALDRRIRELPPHRRVVAPLGVGGHVDHLLVRRAAETVAAGRLLYYEEFPYVEWKRLALRRALGRPGDWVPEVLPVPPELLEQKVAAILAYESQVPAMFRGEARLRKQLRRHQRRAGGERLWRRREETK